MEVNLKKLKEAQEILEALGLPSAQQNEISGYTLIALCGLKKRDSWGKASSQSKTVTKGIMDYLKEVFGKVYAPNTRETVRRQVLHQFVQARLADYNPDNPTLPTNSPRAHYALTKAALKTIRAFGTSRWKKSVKQFASTQGSLVKTYQRTRKMKKISVRLSDGRKYSLSPGKHNEVQAAVVEEFGPRFAPGATLLYLGDTADKSLFVDDNSFAKLGVKISHDKLPDVVFYDSKKRWLYLIEVVTSHGPVSPKRTVELEAMFSKAKVGIIYVSAFPDMAEFRKHMKEIAWETEIWLAEMPDHMIHFNGDRFLGPR